MIHGPSRLTTICSQFSVQSWPLPVSPSILIFHTLVLYRNWLGFHTSLRAGLSGGACDHTEGFTKEKYTSLVLRQACVRAFKSTKYMYNNNGVKALVMSGSCLNRVMNHLPLKGCDVKNKASAGALLTRVE